MKFLLALLVTFAANARAACNIIPPAAQTFPSTLASIISPVAKAGSAVELHLSQCDASPGFTATNVVSITFLPAGPGQPAPVQVSGAALILSDCAAGGSPPCNTLRFVMPATPGLAGPAQIVVTNGAVEVARIGPLFQPHDLGSTCDKQPETVFQNFTIVPLPNDFVNIAAETTQVLATLDGSGSLLIPLKYTSGGLLPLGPGAPVARLLTGTSTIDAFNTTPGTQLIQVDSGDVRSFTLEGRPLPPLIRATNLGNEVFGLADAAESVIRVSRLDAQGQPNFDLTYRRTNGGYGPIVLVPAEYTAASDAAVPLDDLRSTAIGVAFTRNEAIEAINLNATSFGTPTGDTDTTDDVVQIIDVATFASTNTGMAASPTNNPIVGGAVVETGGTLAATLESEIGQNQTDLSGNGQTADDVLRVFTLTGTQRTPNASRLGSPFPAINRRPLAIDGSLVFYREPQADVALTSEGIPNGDDIAVSPNGRLLAVADQLVTSGVLTLVRRDGETGANVRSASGTRTLAAPFDGLAFGPNSGVVYAASPGLNRLSAFNIQLESDRIVIGGNCVFAGDLGRETSVTDGLAGVDGLQGVNRIAVTSITADARTSLYALGAGENALAAFNVSPQFTLCGKPRLAFEQVLRPANFTDPRGLAVTPDGAHVYVAVHGTNRIKGFARTVGAATLTEIGEWIDGGAGGSALAGAADVAISPDGRFVYVLANTDSGITTFSRNTATGVLTFISAIVDSDLIGLAGSLTVSPDGKALYAGTSQGRVIVFVRNTTTGALTLLGLRGPVTTSFQTVRTVASPDSEHVYLSLGRETTARLYTRSSLLQAFDAGTQTNRSGLGTASTLAAVSTGRAVWLEPTTSGLANVKLFNAATNAITPVNGVSRKLALSSKAIVLAVPQTITGDVDGDGSINDDALVLLSTSAPGGPQQIVAADAIELGATDVCEGGSNAGAACVADGTCPGGACAAVAVATSIGAFDFDGHSEVVLRIFRQQTGELITLGHNVADFQVSGNVVAFRTAESGFFTTGDLNGDGDTTDVVMQVYDLAAGLAINTGQATVKCELPGCEPGLPYRIQGDAVYFLTRETDQGVSIDLNANGSTSDTVVQIFRLRTGTSTVVDAPAGLGTLPPLPTQLLGAPILYRQAFEFTLGPDRDGNSIPDGVDVTGDGDFSDFVTLVDGDTDGDGVFDSIDSCVETRNANQQDSDHDGLGDACDPNPSCTPISPGAPPVAPSTAIDCQKAIGSATRTFLKAQAAAVRSCLDKLAAGKLTGSATPLCRGTVSGGTATLPTDTNTGEAVFKAVLKLAATLTEKCTPAALVQLDTCGATPNALATCLAARTTTGISALTTLLYGDVKPITTKAALTCQKAAGKAATKQLVSIVTAMHGCLDSVNKGTLTGNGQALCLGSRAFTGFVAPSDPSTANKFASADLALDKLVQKKCPVTAIAPLDSCGGDAVGVASCARCASFQQAVDLIGDTYGKP